MAHIVPDHDTAFRPKDITILSIALDDVCEALNIGSDDAAREIIATRLVELACLGERRPTRLRDRVLHEAALAEYVNNNLVRSKPQTEIKAPRRASLAAISGGRPKKQK
jgi:hypothetical protein